ncbi:hypothetical protein KC216_21620, partial [Mycobacterium tuberculosis]
RILPIREMPQYSANTADPVATRMYHGAGGTRSSVFSRAAGGAPDTTRRALVFQPLDPTSD